jgi:tetratricopeptide (TPR) repeat protein
MEAWAYVIKADKLSKRLTQEDNFKARALLEKAVELEPHYTLAWFLTTLGVSYREAGRYDDAIKAFQELLKRSRQGEIDPILTHLVLAVTYIYNGQEKEAKLHAAELLKLLPDISNNSIDRIQKQQARRFVDKSRAIRFADALRKALTLAGWDAKEPEK